LLFYFFSYYKKLSLNLFEKKEKGDKTVLIDTTVQEKNITCPTDA